MQLRVSGQDRALQKLSRAVRRGFPLGFTLVELLVVIAIVGLLATIGVIGLQRQARGRALDAAMLTHAREIKLAMQQYVTSSGTLPPLNEAAGSPNCCYWTTAAAGSGQTWEDLEAIMKLKLPRPPHPSREYYEYRTSEVSSGCAGKYVLRMPSLTGSSHVVECDDGNGTNGSVFIISP
jgi:prepilin-type N-terminal cleavage/methylation domain-containing protein